MKRILALLLITAFAVKAEPTKIVTEPSSPTPAAPVDDATAAHQGYPSARYESLWTKSPFAVETPEEAVQESVDYTLVGVAQIEGVTYASLVETRNQDHRLVRSDRTTPDGLIVKSITRKNGETYAVVNRNGEALTLKLQAATEGAAVGIPNAPIPQVGINMPGTLTPAVQQNIPMPGTGGGPGSSPSIRPLIRIHRPIIHVPQRPQETPPQNAAPAPAGGEGTPPAGQPPPPPLPQ